MQFFATNLKNKKRIIQILSEVALLISILVVLVAATYGWFSMNRDVNSNGININVGQADEVIITDYHIYINDENLGSVQEITNSSQKLMNEYDTIFLDRNSQNVVIIEITLANLQGNRLNVNISSSANSFLNQAGLMSENLSNICKFKVISGTQSLNSLSTPSSIYNGAVTAVQNETSQQFVNLNSNSKAEELNFTLNNIYVTDDSAKVFIALDYSVELVNYYISQHNLSITEFNSSEHISFINDALDILFTRGENL